MTPPRPLHKGHVRWVGRRWYFSRDMRRAKRLAMDHAEKLASDEEWFERLQRAADYAGDPITTGELVFMLGLPDPNPFPKMNLFRRR